MKVNLLHRLKDDLEKSHRVIFPNFVIAMLKSNLHSQY